MKNLIINIPLNYCIIFKQPFVVGEFWHAGGPPLLSGSGKRGGGGGGTISCAHVF